MRGLIQCLVLSVEQFSKAKRGFTKRCKKWHRFIRHWTNLIFPLASCTKSNSWIDGYKNIKELGIFKSPFARTCEWILRIHHILLVEYIDATSCVDFTKPCLASQSSCARRANYWHGNYHLKNYNNCGLSRYFLKAFVCLWNK